MMRSIIKVFLLCISIAGYAQSGKTDKPATTTAVQAVNDDLAKTEKLEKEKLEREKQEAEKNEASEKKKNLAKYLDANETLKYIKDALTTEGVVIKFSYNPITDDLQFKQTKENDPFALTDIEKEGDITLVDNKIVFKIKDGDDIKNYDLYLDGLEVTKRQPLLNAFRHLLNLKKAKAELQKKKRKKVDPFDYPAE
ncbi:MAG: hypothetical protein ACO1N9_09265 [Flavobacterium sp.]